MIARIKSEMKRAAIIFALVMVALFFVNEHAFYQMAVYTLYIAVFPAMAYGLYLMARFALK